ncbi:RNA-binding S4 family protein [[Mycoplasma] cavipharyngis]|uniref:RNA-binding S4 domain-containing protein n=1 Tax=[Mycoplasma] cavipharyngis TaxID=92757 RepID=UPI003703AC07
MPSNKKRKIEFMQEVIVKTSYIKLSQLLKLVGIISSGHQAKQYLLKEKVMINNQIRTERGAKIYPNDIVIINNQKFIIKQG